MGVVKTKNEKNGFLIASTIIVFMLVVLVGIKFSMEINDYRKEHQPDPNQTKKYEVRLSNWIGSSYYYCDSVSQKETSIELFNVEDGGNMTISIPESITVYVKENKD